MAKQRPTPEELAQLSGEKGMTFLKMARFLEVDRKTIKRWCLDAGIKEAGIKQPIEDPLDTRAVGSIRPDALSTGLAAIDLECMDKKGLAVIIEEIADKMQNGIPFEELKAKEAQVFIALRDIIVMTMKKEIDLIHLRISKHYHTTLSVEAGRSYNTEAYHDRRVARLQEEAYVRS